MMTMTGDLEVREQGSLNSSLTRHQQASDFDATALAYTRQLYYPSTVNEAVSERRDRRQCNCREGTAGVTA